MNRPPWRGCARLLLCAVLAQAAPAGAVQIVDRVVAVVNDEVVTSGELERRVAQVERQLKREGREVPPREALARQILERLITDRAQMQRARDIGVRVDEAQLDRAVERIAAENGLSVTQLRARVEGDGVAFADFREDVRGEFVRARLREREVESQVVVSDADIDAYLESLRGGAPQPEYLVSQILLRVREDAPSEEVDRQRQRAEDLVRRLREGADFARLATAESQAPDAASGGSLGWRPPERLPQVFLNAVRSLQRGAVTPPVRSPAGFHVLRLDDQRDSAPLPGADKPVLQTHARHILIRPSELVNEAEATRRLQDIRSRVLRGGEDFAALARQFSSDGSAGNGGDLGWVYPGDTVPEFERAMDALAPGQLSEPVRSPFGLHLIQVIERRSDRASPERQRMLARQALRERRVDEAYEEWVRQLRDSTYVEYRNTER